MTTSSTGIEPTGFRDAYARIADVDEATAARLAERFEIRASDPRQHRLWRHFLARSPLVEGARVLEVGSNAINECVCGRGLMSSRPETPM